MGTVSRRCTRARVQWGQSEVEPRFEATLGAIHGHFRGSRFNWAATASKIEGNVKEGPRLNGGIRQEPGAFKELQSDGFVRDELVGRRQLLSRPLAGHGPAP